MRHPLFPDDVQMAFVEWDQEIQAFATQASRTVKILEGAFESGT
jgi:hypothetical protein